MSVDFNFIDILIKNYWIENSSFYIMSEGIIGKSQISDLPTIGVDIMDMSISWECRIYTSPPSSDLQTGESDVLK